MSKIPSAQEFFEKWCNDRNYISIDQCEDIENCLIEFTKLHVEEALNIATTTAEIDDESCESFGKIVISYYINENSIRNAYPLNRIK